MKQYGLLVILLALLVSCAGKNKLETHPTNNINVLEEFRHLISSFNRT
jgi:hypothetical protein